MKNAGELGKVKKGEKIVGVYFLGLSVGRRKRQKGSAPVEWEWFIPFSAVEGRENILYSLPMCLGVPTFII